MPRRSTDSEEPQDPAQVRLTHKEFLINTYNHGYQASENPLNSSGAVIALQKQAEMVGIGTWRRIIPNYTFDSSDPKLEAKVLTYCAEPEIVALQEAFSGHKRPERFTTYSPIMPTPNTLKTLIQFGMAHLVIHKEANDLLAKIEPEWQNRVYQVSQSLLKRTAAQFTIYEGKVGKKLKYKGEEYSL